jgi:hypothetical protein
VGDKGEGVVQSGMARRAITVSSAPRQLIEHRSRSRASHGKQEAVRLGSLPPEGALMRLDPATPV